jgi:haloacetate dehalogenase
MTDLADMFPGFASHWIDTSAGKIFAQSGGSGPPLLAVHGYPETHVRWHRVAPLLAERFTVIVPDLPGYGWSAVPEAQPDHAPYTKRAMAAAMVEMMEALGYVRFRLAGHDRGGRVSYRLALDHPGRLEKLAVLDIIPTWSMWSTMNGRAAFRAWHWQFLAQPAPLPELLLGNAANEYFDLMTSGWQRGKPHAFDPRALAHYRASFTDPARIHASCEDYRAGQSTDFDHDEADRKAGKKIDCPLLVVWGSTGAVSQKPVLDIWREWATDVRGGTVEAGHFVCEENPQATAKALLDFF